MNSRTWPWVVATCASTAVAGTVAVAWWLRGPEQALVWATILALLPVGFAFFGWARAAARAPSTSSPGQVDAAARMLAGQVDRQWREEAGRRGLTDPDPLAVRWRAASPALADHPRLAGTIKGRSDEVARLVQRFLRLPHRRLVVIGLPGAGKTSLAVLLTLELVRRYRESAEVVPALLSPSSWDPGREALHAWIERQLNALYPALRAADYGPTAARSLLAAGRVLPVVDGLDELPAGSKVDALRRINEALREGGPLVLTCRTDDFRAVLEDVDVVTAAAVIEAEPVRVDDAERFLLEAVPPGSPATPAWRALFAEVRRAGDGALATTLANPLMVWLVRAVYADAGRDPSELAAVPDVAAIEDRLLDALVPAVFDHGRQGGHAARAWDARSAHRWLSFLAAHLDHLGTRDLAWWRLRGAAPAIVRLVVFGLLVGLLDELMVRLPVLSGPGSNLVVALILAAVFGLLGAFQDREQRPRRRALHPLVVWPSTGVAVGLLIGGGEGPGTGDLSLIGVFLWLGLVAGLGVGLACWLVARVLPAFQPTRKWRHSIGPGLSVVLVLGALSWMGFGPLSDPLIGLVVWLLGALLVRYLGPETPRKVTPAGGRGFVRTIATWAAASFGAWWAMWLWGYTLPFLGGVAFGALAGLLSPQRPGRATLSLRGRRRAVLQAAGALLAGLPVGVVLLLPYSQLNRTAKLHGRPLTLVSALLLVVLPAVVVIAVTWVIRTPLATDHATSPRATLRHDRDLALFAGPAVALAIGPLVGALLGPLVEFVLSPGGALGSLAANLRTGLFVGLAGGLAALTFGLGRPWLSYLVARTWLALWGRLPWRLMSFLDDAHRLGLLRQVGPVYQFRHAGLQDRLARPRQRKATNEPDEQVSLDGVPSS